MIGKGFNLNNMISIGENKIKFISDGFFFNIGYLFEYGLICFSSL